MNTEAASIISCIASRAIEMSWRGWHITYLTAGTIATQASQCMCTIAAHSIAHTRNATRLTFTTVHGVTDAILRVANNMHLSTSSIVLWEKASPISVKNPRDAIHAAHLSNTPVRKENGDGKVALVSGWSNALCAMGARMVGVSTACCTLLYR